MHHTFTFARGWGLAIALFVVSACAQTTADPAQAVSLDQAKAELDAGRAILIDVREPKEHAAGVAPSARLLPMSELPPRAAEVPDSPDQPVLLICRTQNRSKAVLEKLRAAKGPGSYASVRYVEGGMSQWAQRGWPLVTPQGAPVSPAPASSTAPAASAASR